MLETQLSVDAGAYNWDEPAAMDIVGMQSTLGRLRNGESVDIDAFSFATRQRDVRVHIPSADFIVVEGLFVLSAPELRAALDYRLYVHASQETTWRRKLTRDSQAARGGHDHKYLRTQFEQAWRMSQQHVVPSMRLPGVQVIDNDGQSDAAAWEVTVHSIVSELSPELASPLSSPSVAAVAVESRQASPSTQARAAVALAALAMAHSVVRGSRGTLSRVATTLAAAALTMAVGSLCWPHSWPTSDARPRPESPVQKKQHAAGDEGSVGTQLKQEVTQCRAELSAIGAERTALRRAVAAAREGSAEHERLQHDLKALDESQRRLVCRIQQSETAMRSRGISHARDR